MPEALPDRTEVADLKWIKWVVVCVAVLLLVGCSNANIQEHGQEEIWEMNEAMTQMIMDATGCNERRAGVILEVFQEVRLAEPVNVRSLDSNSNDIVVETIDGAKYEVGINKKYYVYSIKDMGTGEYVYMVIE